jgi:hypothetical protein
MREVGAAGCLGCAQRQRLRAVATREDPIGCLTAEGLLTDRYGEEASPAGRRAGGMPTSGARTDQGQVRLTWLFS